MCVSSIASTLSQSKTWYRDTPPSLWTGSTRTIGRSSFSVAPPHSSRWCYPHASWRCCPRVSYQCPVLCQVLANAVHIHVDLVPASTRARPGGHAALFASLAVLLARALTVSPTRVPTLPRGQALLSTRLHRSWNQALVVGPLWHCCVRSVRQSLRLTLAHPVRLLHVLCV